MFVLLVLVDHQEGGEALHSVVDSVHAEVSAGLFHEVHGPVLVAVASISEFVVLDHLKSLLENARVEEGV